LPRILDAHVRRRWTAALLVLAATACDQYPTWPTGRLVDRPEAGPAASLLIGPTTKRALRGPQPEHTFALDGAPRHPTLVFAAGVASGDVAVRFEVALRRAGTTEVIHALDVESGAWVDGRVDLADRQLAGSELVLRRAAIATDAAALDVSGWGDAVLLPADGPEPAPSVILISLDTLRADALGVYGAGSRATPVLDGLAADGVQFVQAYSPSVWTVPSHEALLTGRYPYGFGDFDDGGRVLPATNPPPADAPSLAGLLRDAGYLTAAFTGGGWIDARVGTSNRRSFADGFDTYFGYQRPPQAIGVCQADRLDGTTVFGGARAWLRERGAAPFLLFVHTYEPHDRCPFGAARKVGVARYRWDDERLPDGKRQIEALYEGLVGQTDRLVGELLDELAALGRADDTLVVVTSDHGELFGEHDDDGHGAGRIPYEELSRVPLLMRFPGRLPAGTRITTPASVTSVGGTILALLGLEASLPEPPLPGLALDGGGPATVYVDAQRLLAVREGRWKLIAARGRGRGAVLFDVEADPDEGSDRSHREVQVRQRLEALAHRYWDAAGPASAETGTAPTPEIEEQLRQLGYVE